MWAVSVQTDRLIAIVAQNAVTIRETMLFQPAVKVASNRPTEFGSVLVSTTVDVIDSEKLHVGLAAARARTAVVVDDEPSVFSVLDPHLDSSAFSVFIAVLLIVFLSLVRSLEFSRLFSLAIVFSPFRLYRFVGIRVVSFFFGDLLATIRKTLFVFLIPRELSRSAFHSEMIRVQSSCGQ